MPISKTDQIGEVLKSARNIAVVGLSDSPLRPSHGVAAYMQSQGYRILPINPTITDALGEPSYRSLLDVLDAQNTRYNVLAQAESARWAEVERTKIEYLEKQSRYS